MASTQGEAGGMGPGGSGEDVAFLLEQQTREIEALRAELVVERNKADGVEEKILRRVSNKTNQMVATIAAQGKEITSLESKLRQAERQLAAGRDTGGNAKEHEGDDDGAMQQHHSSIDASVSALEELVRASLESARGNVEQVSSLHQELADERSKRQGAEEAVERERVMRAKAEGKLEEERRRGVGRHVDDSADLLRTQSGASRATGTISGFETHFSRRAAGLDGGATGEISPDILSPRGDKEEVASVDEVVRLRAALAEEVRKGAEASLARQALERSMSDQESMNDAMALQREEMHQRIIEQLDELNEQQATVSDLTLALTDMQAELDRTREREKELSALLARRSPLTTNNCNDSNRNRSSSGNGKDALAVTEEDNSAPVCEEVGHAEDDMEAQFLAVKENLAMVREDLRGKLADAEAGVAALEDDRVRLIRVVMSLPGGEGKLLPGDVEALEKGGALPRGEEEEEMRVEAIVERLAKSQRELEEAQARLSVAVKDRGSLSSLPCNGQQQLVGRGTDQEFVGGHRGRYAMEDLEAEVERLRGGGGGWADRVAGLERELGERDSVVLDLQRRLISLSQTVMSLEQKLDGEGGRGSARGEGGGDGEGRADRLQLKLDRLVHATKALKAESQDALVGKDVMIEKLHRQLEEARSNFKAQDVSRLHPAPVLSHSSVETVSFAVQTGGEAGQIWAEADVKSLLMRVEGLEKDNAKLEGEIRCVGEERTTLVEDKRKLQEEIRGAGEFVLREAARLQALRDAEVAKLVAAHKQEISSIMQSQIAAAEGEAVGMGGADAISRLEEELERERERAGRAASDAQRVAGQQERERKAANEANAESLRLAAALTQEREGAKETAGLVAALEEERRVLSDALEYRSSEVSELRAALEDHRRQLLECRDALREAREDIDGPRGATRFGSDGKESADGGRVFSDRGGIQAGHRAGRGSGNQIEPSGRCGDSSGADAAALKQLRLELASLADARAESERALEDAEGRKRLAERAMQDVGAETERLLAMKRGLELELEDRAASKQRVKALEDGARHSVELSKDALGGLRAHEKDEIIAGLKARVSKLYAELQAGEEQSLLLSKKLDLIRRNTRANKDGHASQIARLREALHDKEEELSELRSALQKTGKDERDADLLPEDSSTSNGLTPGEMRTRIDELEKQVAARELEVRQLLDRPPSHHSSSQVAAAREEELERLLAISQQKVVSAHQWTSEVQRDADALSARYRGLRRRVGRHVTSACRRGLTKAALEAWAEHVRRPMTGHVHTPGGALMTPSRGGGRDDPEAIRAGESSRGGVVRAPLSRGSSHRGAGGQYQVGVGWGPVGDNINVHVVRPVPVGGSQQQQQQERQRARGEQTASWGAGGRGGGERRSGGETVIQPMGVGGGMRGVGRSWGGDGRRRETMS